MPSVASETTPYAPSYPMPPKPAPASDQAAGSPFESLLDDSAPPPPPADNTPAAQADAPPPLPKGKSGKTDNTVPSANAGKPVKSAKIDAKTGVKTAATVGAKIDATADTKTEKPDGDGKNAGDGKSDAKTAEQQLAADVGAPTDGAAPDSPVQLTPSAPQAASAAAATGIVIAAAPAPVPPGTGAKSKGVIGSLKINTTPTNLTAPSGKPDTANVKSAAPEKTADLADNGKPKAAANGLETDKDKTATGVTPADVHRFTNAPAQAAANSDTQSSAIKAPDGPQPPTLTMPVQNAAPTLTTPAPAPQLMPQAAAIPLAGVGIEIAAKALEGKNRFEIRLDPPELGRIEVRLDVDSDGNVATRLIADRADTLDLLRRDSSGLERALQDAGLKTADNGMQFQLRDQTMGQNQRPSGPDVAQLVASDATLTANDPTQPRHSRHSGGLDISV